MTKLMGIAIKHRKMAVMQTLDTALISLEKGVENDFRGKPSARQVTVLSQQDWHDVNRELNAELPWTTRRANLLVGELDWVNSTGKILRIGSVELLITQETDPCDRMRKAAVGLYDALKTNWRGGVCCRVVKPGQVSLGDNIMLLESY